MSTIEGELKNIQESFEEDLERLTEKRDAVLDKYKGKLSDVQVQRLHEKLSKLYG